MVFIGVDAAKIRVPLTPSVQLKHEEDCFMVTIGSDYTGGFTFVLTLMCLTKLRAIAGKKIDCEIISETWNVLHCSLRTAKDTVAPSYEAFVVDLSEAFMNDLD
jgi:hypothetical protein